MGFELTTLTLARWRYRPMRSNRRSEERRFPAGFQLVPASSLP
jgi:hypothetical protein